MAITIHDAFRWMGRAFSVLLGMALLVTAIAWMSGAFRVKIPPLEAAHLRPPVSARGSCPVETLKTAERVEVVGTVEPRHKTAVSSQVLAAILQVHVRAGDRVEQGQALLRLDDRELRAQIREAEAAVAAAAADLATRERDFARYKQMYADQAATGEEYDRSSGAYQVAAAQQQRAQEQLHRLEVMLTYTRIQAHTSGLVVERLVDPGDLAVPGKPLLTLHDPSQRDLHASVRETLSRFVRPGMTLPIHIDALDLSLEGTVREIVPQALPLSRTVLVKVALPAEAAEGLYNGMFGRMAIPVGTVDRLVVPLGTVVHVGQLDLVDVVAGDGAIERRFIRTGKALGDKIEVLSGLDAGERVALPAPAQAGRTQASTARTAPPP